jgi:putative SOS response-associated peptidase YedK
MCGRFTLRTPKKELVELFTLEEFLEELRPRYNIAPRQNVAVIGLKQDGVKRGLAHLEWGLLPADAESPNSIRPINARGETVNSHPMFERPFREQRCLIPADGFYEWKEFLSERETDPPAEKRRKTKPKSIKQPFHFRMKDGAPFAFAGFWDVWKQDQLKILSTCLITTKPNELTRTIHDRMPVIVPSESYEAWLSHDTAVSELRSLIRPYPAGPMEFAPVNRLVNSSKIDSPECLAEQASRISISDLAN